jgi:hypothetical protein
MGPAVGKGDVGVGIGVGVGTVAKSVAGFFSKIKIVPRPKHCMVAIKLSPNHGQW